MIVKGEFDLTYRRPYVQGLLFIPRWSKWRRIDFLVDTGSDSTILNPSDGTMMDIDYARLKYNVDIYGVGHSIKAASQNALVSFATEEGRVVVYSINIEITENIADIQILPSQLGTNILHRWQMLWNSCQDQLEFTVLSADTILPRSLIISDLPMPSHHS